VEFTWRTSYQRSGRPSRRLGRSQPGYREPKCRRPGGPLAWQCRRPRVDAARAMLPLRSLPPAPREWRGPLSRSRSRGQRSNGRRRFHLHLHGVSAEDIAAILAREDRRDRTGPRASHNRSWEPAVSRRRGLPGRPDFPATGRRDSQRRAPCSCYTPGSAPPLAAGPVPHRPAPRRRRDRCLPAHVQVARLPPTPPPAPRRGCRGSRQPPVPHRGRDCRHNVSGTLRPCKACGKPW
jgi:hypothetical protein